MLRDVHHAESGRDEHVAARGGEPAGAVQQRVELDEVHDDAPHRHGVRDDRDGCGGGVRAREALVHERRVHHERRARELPQRARVHEPHELAAAGRVRRVVVVE